VESALEVAKPVGGVTEPTPNEGAGSTQSEGEKPTVSITETPEFRRELDKALGKSTESINRQFNLQKKAADAAKADSEAAKASIRAAEAQIEELQKAHDELAAARFDDPDEKQRYLKFINDKRSIAEEKKQVAKERAEAENKLLEAEKLTWSVIMAKKSNELVKETGIDSKELEDCQTEAEMEAKAYKYKLSAVKEPEVTQKFDSGVSSGGSTRVFTRQQLDQLASLSIEEYAKIKPEIDKARKEGRIKY